MKQPRYVCSYPKSGRTWVRYMLSHYLRATCDLGLDVSMATMFRACPNDTDEPDRGAQVYAFGDNPRMPLVLFSHALPRDDHLRAQHLVMLIRSPLDTLVSKFCHWTHQWNWAHPDLGAFLRQEHGISDLVAYLNAWSKVWADRSCEVVSYESMKADSSKAFSSILSALGLVVDPVHLAAAAQAGRFDAMQRQEQHQPPAGHRYNGDAPETWRIRRGKVGGYVDYLSEADIAFVRACCAEHLTDPAWQLLEAHDLADELRPRQ